MGRHPGGDHRPADPSGSPSVWVEEMTLRAGRADASGAIADLNNRIGQSRAWPSKKKGRFGRRPLERVHLLILEIGFQVMGGRGRYSAPGSRSLRPSVAKSRG